MELKRTNYSSGAPLEEVAGKLKMVDPNSAIIQEVKGLGICFGD